MRGRGSAVARSRSALRLRRAAPAAATPGWRRGGAAVARRARRAGAAGPARNVILFLGDGMGIATVTAARILEGQLRGEPGEENVLAFERFPYTALSKTYNTEPQTPESAGTMTAIVTGVEDALRRALGGRDACRAAISRPSPGTSWRRSSSRPSSAASRRDRHDHDRHPRHARRDLRALARTATGRTTRGSRRGARGAASRDIARQLIELPHGDGIEVVLGGGRASFLPATRAGSRVPGPEGRARSTAATSPRSGGSAGRGRPTSGTASSFDAIDPAATRSPARPVRARRTCSSRPTARATPAGEPSLSQMTAKAIDLLARAPKRLLPDGRGRPHRPRPSRRQRLPRARRDDRALERGATSRSQKTRSERDADRGDGGPRPTSSRSPAIRQRGNPILGKVRPHRRRAAGPARSRRSMPGQPYTTLGYANGPGYTGASAEQPEGPKRFPHRAAATPA